jgi:hypothetical protein
MSFLWGRIIGRYFFVLVSNICILISIVLLYVFCERHFIKGAMREFYTELMKDENTTFNHKNIM